MLDVCESSKLGDLLRYWGRHQRMSQMDLAAAANISARHLSFVETGKAKPRRRLVLSLATALRMPFRHTNSLLAAAGYAPQYRTLPLSDERMQPVQLALKRLLEQHEPFPAIVVDQSYDILMANHGFNEVVAWFAGREALVEYPNIYRLVFASDGLRPFFDDWPFIERALLSRLHEEAIMRQDEALWELYDVCRAERRTATALYPNRDEAFSVPVLDFTLRKAEVALSFFSSMTTFGAALDVTVQELHIESLFPADTHTQETFERLFGTQVDSI